MLVLSKTILVFFPKHFCLDLLCENCEKVTKKVNFSLPSLNFLKKLVRHSYYFCEVTLEPSSLVAVLAVSCQELLWPISYRSSL